MISNLNYRLRRAVASLNRMQLFDVFLNDAISIKKLINKITRFQQILRASEYFPAGEVEGRCT